ncbi:MAG: hypothetical protein PVSMB4_00990 [Ktedonobacterales bacterium]
MWDGPTTNWRGRTLDVSGIRRRWIPTRRADPEDRAAKGAQLVEATNRSSGTLEELVVGAAPMANDEQSVGDGDERRDEAFEATIVRLDRAAAELLLRLAGL